uniref:Uncharacterized protein n=1 Tax=Chromera velia CCMP2878 TaxID=1169474 RepID=A0A0G4HM40_9ALVE|eukprot:Cvel_28981.t1-p1 / transcript=Cvel_28981.t1 / gene=Cvel_28981 / organism=Chromera_velia_CCMP2878 / gene_product=hypothetical protein / transcript_product=hypothetical protein / location=Cvel_scaffold3895:8538-8909(-) / protein_length=124 / sequence_SO=supercontig / SO=protein_coding / is_pseudo=false
MLRAVLAFLCVALASAASEYCVWTGKTDCSGDSVCVTYTSGECRADTDSSTKFTDKDSKTCVTTYTTTDCSGDSSEVCYAQNECQSLTVLDVSTSWKFSTTSAGRGIAPLFAVLVGSLFVSFSV